jgi:hypothetical protein
MTPADPAKYRSGAELCRKKARSFSDSSEWVRFSQQREKLAQLAEALASRPCATSRLFLPTSTRQADEFGPDLIGSRSLPRRPLSEDDRV